MWKLIDKHHHPEKCTICKCFAGVFKGIGTRWKKMINYFLTDGCDGDKYMYLDSQNMLYGPMMNQASGASLWKCTKN